MAKFRIDLMGGLARQMQFTPGHVLGAQLSSAEELLHTLDPAKAYPSDFVLYRITGHRPRQADGDLLAGVALQHDLGLLIEQLSETQNLRAAESTEPVLSIADVVERFNVTSKTIQRWRRKGLAARRFIFSDGKRRVGFYLHSVERFIASHEDQVSRSANFSQVQESERREILRRARRLAERCHCCRNEIARRIARHLRRSPLTILHTIKKHDQERPELAIFPLAPKGLSAEQRAVVVNAHRHGTTMRALARRLCRPRSAIYRVVMEDRIARLNRKKIKFIDDPLYHSAEAAQAIDQIARQEPLADGSPNEKQQVPKDLPAYLQSLYRTPLLGAARERALFLQFNFHKFQFVQARRRMEVQFARSRQLNEMERHLRNAQRVKNQIVQANLRLVVSIARRHLRPGVDLMELVSDGNILLMRAAESFDIHRGNRFSTYATLALMKGFARSVSQMASRPYTNGLQLEEMPDAPRRSPLEQFAMEEDVRTLLRRLNDRERGVLVGHFGLDESAPATYEQIGRRLGLSRQRIRQIEKTALAKLRKS